MTANVDVSKIANQIIAEATKQPGHTWNLIRKSAPIYINGYVQNLADIAAGVAANEITDRDKKMYIQNASLLLVMGIANTSQIVLAEVQAFMDKVIGIMKETINKALPIAIL